jgi:hypothetical protein
MTQAGHWDFTTAIPEETSWTKSTPKDEKRTYFQDSHPLYPDN